jgi:hypothetical protein
MFCMHGCPQDQGTFGNAAITAALRASGQGTTTVGTTVNTDPQRAGCARQRAPPCFCNNRRHIGMAVALAGE